MSLKKQAASGVKWSALSQIGRQAMQFATTTVLARLLLPSDFGLVGMATIVLGFINLFSDLGTSAAVIQRKNTSDSLLQSIFWINIGFGFLGTAILFVCSPLIASFYQEPRVIPVLRVLSLTFFISGFSILQKALLERDLAFNTLAKVELSAVVSGSVVGIGSALLGFGVWSLVYQSLAVVIATTLSLWVATRWKPQLTFCGSELREVSNYSLNLTGFNIYNYFSRNADYLLIGRFLGTQDLGYYTLAYRLMIFPLLNISLMLSRVMFPVFSQFQDDNAKFSRVYLKVVGAIALITFPMMIALWAVAEPFIVTLFGSQWRPVILLLMILAPVGMGQSIGTTVGQIYQAKGRTDWLFRWGVVAGLVFMIAFVIGLHWGIVGVATGYAIAYTILQYPSFAIPFRLINLRVWDLGTILVRPLFCSLLMLMVLLAVKFLLPTNLSSSWILGILVSTGCITYLLVSWLINREQMQQFLGMVGLNK
jgi:PST family polysaccharide transporter